MIYMSEKIFEEVLYTSKISNLTAEFNNNAFTSYNWWKQCKEVVEPLLDSLEANIEVSTAFRHEQKGIKEGRFRFVPINESTCLVISHTKQAENTVNGEWNTIYCYQCNWAPIVAHFADNGTRAPHLFNRVAREIFKKFGKERKNFYLGRWFSDMNTNNGIHVIESLPIVVGIPLGRKKYKSFIFPMKKELLYEVKKAKDKLNRVIVAYHNYSELIYAWSIEEAQKNVEFMWKVIEMLLSSSMFTVGGGKIEQQIEG